MRIFGTVEWAPDKELLLLLTYIGKICFEIRDHNQKCINKNIPLFNLKVLFQANNRFFSGGYLKEKGRKVWYLQWYLLWQNYKSF